MGLPDIIEAMFGWLFKIFEEVGYKLIIFVVLGIIAFFVFVAGWIKW